MMDMALCDFRRIPVLMASVDIVSHFFDVYFALRDLQKLYTGFTETVPGFTETCTGFTDPDKLSYDRSGPPQTSGNDAFIKYLYVMTFRKSEKFRKSHHSSYFKLHQYLDHGSTPIRGGGWKLNCLKSSDCEELFCRISVNISSFLELKNECLWKCPQQARKFSGFDSQNHQKYEENR